MNWFLAKLIFEIVQEDAHGSSQFDEQIRLLQAADLPEAMEKAEEIAHQEEQEFFNTERKKICWRFTGIPELQELGDLEDGLKIYSLSPAAEDAEDYLAYMDFIKRKYSALKKGLGKMQPAV